MAWSGGIQDPQAVCEAIRGLSPREREILALMARGWSNERISRELVLSPRTIESHVRHIFFKLGLQGRPDLHRRVAAAMAYRAAVG